MPLVQTRGAASAQGFGEFAQATAVNYIEDVFSTYLYTGNGSTQTITNGIDLSTKGGLVWFKSRSGTYGTQSHVLTSNELTNWTNYLSSNTTGDTAGLGATAFTPSTTGFALNSVFAGINDSGTNYASWTFRKQPKFFDIVTYTGDGLSAQQIAHSLGSVPGCVIVKPTSTTGNWGVWHRGNGTTDYTGLSLNQTTAAQDSGAGFYSGFTSTYFTPRLVEDASLNVGNLNGVTYVAYVFAHDAGGFGLTGTDNVISCGSFTSGNPSSTPVTVTLGYEPQWILVKPNNSANSWAIYDTMRGWSDSTGGDAYLLPNTSGAEGTGTYGYPTATGFVAFNGFNTSTQCIYIAIRRGPMKVPTSGTSVFLPSTAAATTPFNVGFPPDMALWAVRDSTGNKEASSRLQGEVEMFTNTTGAETSVTGLIGWNSKTNFWFQNITGGSMINWMFRRAPSFCDVICYTGTGANTTFTHNLGVVPELMIVKRRDAIAAWDTYCSALANTEYLVLNSTASKATGATRWNSTTPTSSVFSVGTSTTTNASAGTYVAYLFATCAGVSKVGSYTGNGSTQTIDCGFGAGGARFVLIKRTDATGDWYTYDTARGMTVLTDPYTLLNTNTAETATLGSVTTVSTGFAVDNSILAGINVASPAAYIFLAIA